MLWFRKKIKRRAVTGRIEEGGLGMIDTENYFHASKPSWVKIVCEADTYVPSSTKKVLNVWKVINIPNVNDSKQIKLFQKILIFYHQVTEGYTLFVIETTVMVNTA